MSPHFIQLRAPWTACQPAPLAPPEIPDTDWPTVPFPARFPAASSARLARSFHRPSGLQAGDRVCVMLLARGQIRAVWLGSTRLVVTRVQPPHAAPAPPTWVAELTPHLQTRNRLVIDLEADPASPADELTLDEVRLQIDNPQST